MRVDSTMPYTGVRAGTIFRAGTGYTSDPTALTYFGRAGYTVRAGEPPADWHTTRPSDPAPVRALTLPPVTTRQEAQP